MNSIKSKTNKYILMNNKAIAAVFFTTVFFAPNNDYVNVVVVWEWEDQAQNSFFAIVTGTSSFERINTDLNTVIDYVCDYGTDVTHLKEYRKLFPHIFKN